MRDFKSSSSSSWIIAPSLQRRSPGDHRAGSRSEPLTQHVNRPSCPSVLRVRAWLLWLPVQARGQISDIPLLGLAWLCVLLCLLCYAQEERFAFLAEWYDPSAALLRRYQLLYYPKDGSVEMVRSYTQISDPFSCAWALSLHMYVSLTQFDMKNQRTFLRRTKFEELHPEDLFVGNRVNIFSRQLNLIGYGDQYTANKLGSKKER